MKGSGIMCKYCKLYPDGNGKFANSRVVIVRDGKHVSEVRLYRFIDENGDAESYLTLHECVAIDSGLMDVKERSVNIHYCPFCGEKL